MPSIAIFTFDSDDEMDFDISFAKFLAVKKDRAAAADPIEILSAPDGIELMHTELIESNVVKLWVREPVASGDYKFKVRLSTQGGRKKSAEVTIRVSD